MCDTISSKQAESVGEDVNLATRGRFVYPGLDRAELLSFQLAQFEAPDF
jgi:hypothetical protein